jgi:dipeptidyl-peptidase-4
MRITTSKLFLLAGLLLLPLGAQAQEKTTSPPEITLEDLFSEGTFRGESFEGGRWADEGPVIRYTERATDTDTTHLMSLNLRTQEKKRLINGENLYAEDVDRNIQIEGYEYGPDGERVLIYTDSKRVWRRKTKGYYYVYDLDSKELTPVSDRDDGYQMFAKFSPDGERVAFVRKRNLFMVDLAGMSETQLTENGAPGGIINGTSDWVYEEEFGLRDGFSWSPDSRHLAFVQLDESATRDFKMADLRGQYPEIESFRYPKAGEKNSEIRVGVIDVTADDREPQFFDTGTWNEGGDSLEYIPKFGWTPAKVGGGYRVWIFRMNRDQNELDVLYGNPEVMTTRTVLSEAEDTWISVDTGFSDLDVGKINYLKDNEHFVWVSERDGHRHLYLYENDGDPVMQLTSGDWDVTNFHGIDEESGRIYFTSTQESSIERHLYRKNVSIADESAASEPVQITERPGWHSVSMSSDLEYYIDRYSRAGQPTTVTLHTTAGGERLRVLEGNEALKDTLAQYDLPQPEFTTVEGADGTPLNAYVIKPNDFDENEEHPLLMYVYGGPGAQTVRNAWGGSRMLWHQYLARARDVVVVSVDNRGTGGRGKAFKSATYKQLGKLEAADQIAAAQSFAEKSYVDAGCIGIWGWSYGGYMTLMSMLRGEGPQTFRAGLAVAPVTDWRQYDTIYTERYMSTPQKNEQGYEQAAPVNYADNLREEQSLLLVHGSMDDNVHFQNAVHMITALQEAGKQFDMMMYPGRDHGIYGGNTRLHLFRMLTGYLGEHLIEAGDGEMASATR